MNQNQNPADGYVFKIELSLKDLTEFQNAFAEMAAEHEAEFLEMTGYIEANQVINSIKAKL